MQGLNSKYEGKAAKDFWDFSIFDDAKREEEKMVAVHFKKSNVIDGVYTCKRKDSSGKICGSKKCIQYSIQTRSQDEGQTTKIECTKCGNVWILAD